MTLQNGPSARAIVVHPDLRDAGQSRSATARLDEAVGLALAIRIEVVHAEHFVLTRPRPATLIGGGKVEEIATLLDTAELRPELVIVDAALSPVQHRNLEKAWNAKVLDRTALILEIFGERARTSEGRLQVDLAHLMYQRSRLVRSWTHLERQRGGAGFMGGPGERQIESDRRALAEKIDRLKAKLADVQKTRALQRAKRKRAPYPVVALVGYTNAGKSTLFNRLTAADVMAQDLLFATLDPTMRAVDLPSGQRIILSDTVGFISDLPTHLVAAFRATLEEVLEADVIIHVRDASHPDSDAQRRDVMDVLRSLGVDSADGRPLIEAMNKMDLVEDGAIPQSPDIGALAMGAPPRVAISALTGAGVDTLCHLIDRFVTANRQTYEVAIPLEDGAARSWLYATGEVMSETSDDAQTLLVVRLSAKACGQFQKAHPSAQFVVHGAEARRSA